MTRTIYNDEYEDIKQAKIDAVSSIAESVSASSLLELVSYDIEELTVRIAFGNVIQFDVKPYADRVRGPRVVVFSTGMVSIGLPMTILPSSSDCKASSIRRGLDIGATLRNMSVRTVVAYIEKHIANKKYLVERFVPKESDITFGSTFGGMTSIGQGVSPNDTHGTVVKRDCCYVLSDWVDALEWCGIPLEASQVDCEIDDEVYADSDTIGSGSLRCNRTYELLDDELPTIDESGRHVMSIACYSDDEPVQIRRRDIDYTPGSVPVISASPVYYRVSKIRSNMQENNTIHEGMLACEAIRRYGGIVLKMNLDYGDGIGGWKIAYSMHDMRGNISRNDMLAKISVTTENCEETIAISYSGATMSSLAGTYPFGPTERALERMASELRAIIKDIVVPLSRGKIEGRTLLVMNGIKAGDGKREEWVHGPAALDKRIPVVRADSNPRKWYASRVKDAKWNKVKSAALPMMVDGNDYSYRSYDAIDAKTGRIFRDAAIAYEVAVWRYKPPSPIDEYNDKEGGTFDGVSMPGITFCNDNQDDSSNKIEWEDQKDNDDLNSYSIEEEPDALDIYDDDDFNADGDVVNIDDEEETDIEDEIEADIEKSATGKLKHLNRSVLMMR